MTGSSEYAYSGKAFTWTCAFLKPKEISTNYVFFKEMPVLNVLALDILTEFVESTVIYLNIPINVCQKISTL